MIAGPGLIIAVASFLAPIGGHLTDVYNCHGHGPGVVTCQAYLVGVPVNLGNQTQRDPMNLGVTARRSNGRWVISGGLF